MIDLIFVVSTFNLYSFIAWLTKKFVQICHTLEKRKKIRGWGGGPVYILRGAQAITRRPWGNITLIPRPKAEVLMKVYHISELETEFYNDQVCN